MSQNFWNGLYEWLVVSGSSARFRGTGTIGGEGQYEFTITATDGQAQGGSKKDQFRIRIKDSESSQVVYDNLMGQPENVTNGLDIAGGNIIVHFGIRNLVGEDSSQPAESGRLLTDSFLTQTVNEAIRHWAPAGYDVETLRSIEVVRADLTGLQLGIASDSANMIWIDNDAAGFGWNTQSGHHHADGEYPDHEGYNLLHVVMHEFGHILGFEHSEHIEYAKFGNLMSATLHRAAAHSAPVERDFSYTALTTSNVTRGKLRSLHTDEEGGVNRMMASESRVEASRLRRDENRPPVNHSIRLPKQSQMMLDISSSNADNLAELDVHIQVFSNNETLQTLLDSVPN